MPATCGAAAEVPKKFGKLALFRQAETVLVSSLAGILNPRKVSLPPSGPTKSGFCRNTGDASRAPVTSNRIGSPPAEENDSRVGVNPQDGVFAKNAAPTPAAPA